MTKRIDFCCFFFEREFTSAGITCLPVWYTGEVKAFGVARTVRVRTVYDSREYMFYLARRVRDSQGEATQRVLRELAKSVWDTGCIRE